MSRKTVALAMVVATLAFLFIPIGFVHAQQVEVWYCGDFNMQGGVDQQTIQFYPFGAKIGEFIKIPLGNNAILALNPTRSGNIYAYLLQRQDGAPIYWIWFDSSFSVQNSTKLFDSCSYRVQ